MMKNKKRWCFLTLKEQSLFFILPFKQKRLNLSRTIDNFGLDNLPNFIIIHEIFGFCYRYQQTKQTIFQNRHN